MFGLFRRRRETPAATATPTAGTAGPAGPRAGVAVFPFSRGPGVSHVLPGESPPERDLASTVALVLAGRFGGSADAAAGDVLVVPAAPARLVCAGPDPGLLLLLRQGDAPAGEAPLRVGRDGPSGTPVPGVTGVRFLLRSAGSSVLRLGPPPGARWVVSGLRCFAVFQGKLEVMEGDGGIAVRAGQVAFVDGADAPLHLLSGGDSALAIGLGGPDASVRLA